LVEEKGEDLNEGTDRGGSGLFRSEGKGVFFIKLLAINQHLLGGRHRDRPTQNNIEKLEGKNKSRKRKKPHSAKIKHRSIRESTTSGQHPRTNKKKTKQG